MKNRVIAIPSIVITTLVYALVVATTFFEMNNVYGERIKKFVIVDTSLYTHQQTVEVEKKDCKSPCPESSEMCIQMCA